MRAGTARHQIVIQQRSDTQSASGAMIPAWTTFATLNAAIDPLQGRELQAAQQVVATVSHRISCLYLPGVKPSMRVQYVVGASTRYFDINAVINVTELGRDLQMLCTERVGQD